MVVLRAVPHALHVMLGGPREARLQQGMTMESVDRRTARQRLDANDRARVDYIRCLYGVDPDDPDLFHLRLDSTAVDLETCVDIIVAASRSRQVIAGQGAGGGSVAREARPSPRRVT
jgi:cytidylate kinase